MYWSFYTLLYLTLTLQTFMKYDLHKQPKTMEQKYKNEDSVHY